MPPKKKKYNAPKSDEEELKKFREHSKLIDEKSKATIRDPQILVRQINLVLQGNEYSADESKKIKEKNLELLKRIREGKNLLANNKNVEGKEEEMQERKNYRRLSR